MFTQGPWKATEGSYGNYIGIVGSDNKYVARVSWGKHDNSNANLIAAAPEMYGALVDAEFLLRKAGQLAGPMQDSFRRASADIKAIIAKVEGK